MDKQVKSTKLTNLLTNHYNWVNLNGDEQYWCRVCNIKQDAKQKVEMKTAPGVLVISLKRFLKKWNEPHATKINTKVEAPMMLPLNDLGICPAQYMLTGIIVHQGTAQFGHYYSMNRNPDEAIQAFKNGKTKEFGNWVMASDVDIKAQFRTHQLRNHLWGVGSQTPYVYFYTRVQTISPKSSQNISITTIPQNMPQIPSFPDDNDVNSNQTIQIHHWM